MNNRINCPKCGFEFAVYPADDLGKLGVTETRDATPSAIAAGTHRTFEATEIRAEKTQDGKYRIYGHAAVFNSRSKPLTTKSGKKFVEQIQPGAFKRSLESGRDIAMLDDHDPKKVLARTSAKTLKLSEDERGLKFDATLPDTSTARDLVANIDHGNVRGVSFGFGDAEDKWEMDGDTPVRTLLDIPLGEVSATPFPAYEATDIAVRADEAIARLAAGEKDVRCYGYGMGSSRSETEMRMDNCRSECRSLHETAHNTHEHLLRNPSDPGPSDDEKRSAKHLFDEAGRTRSKLAALREHLRTNYLFDGQADPDDDPDDTPTNQPPAHDREPERSAHIGRLVQELRTAIDLGLPDGPILEAIKAATNAPAPQK